MVNRTFWRDRIEELWQRRSVIWLSGVRRTGKTCLAQSLREVEYFDCELPRIRRMMEDPESFLAGWRGRRIVLDEVHRLENPSELLKIAADHFPTVKVLATGSSTLGAAAKFRDTLAGRKAQLWLTPMTLRDLEDFRLPGLERRLAQGGLPPCFLADGFPEREFQEWLDAYWAKDIQELFRLERRHAFAKLLQLLLAQSGGIFEASHLAGPCEISRTTVMNYLEVLESTFVIHRVRPFSSRRQTEIIAAPKVYGFDTGFVLTARAWTEVRREDLGQLWEHFVLNELHAHLQSRDIHYWRDKSGHEVDFIIVRRGRSPLAIECKWSADGFDARNLIAFSAIYRQARCLVVAQDVERPFKKRFGDLEVEFIGLTGLIEAATS